MQPLLLPSEDMEGHFDETNEQIHSEDMVGNAEELEDIASDDDIDQQEIILRVRKAVELAIDTSLDVVDLTGGPFSLNYPPIRLLPMEELLPLRHLTLIPTTELVYNSMEAVNEKFHPRKKRRLSLDVQLAKDRAKEYESIDGLKLLLGMNQIDHIPWQMFLIANLAVLSLRTFSSVQFKAMQFYLCRRKCVEGNSQSHFSIAKPRVFVRWFQRTSKSF